MKKILILFFTLALIGCSSAPPKATSFNDLSGAKEEEINKDIESISAEISNKNVWE